MVPIADRAAHNITSSDQNPERNVHVEGRAVELIRQTCMEVSPGDEVSGVRRSVRRRLSGSRFEFVGLRVGKIGEPDNCQRNAFSSLALICRKCRVQET